MITKEELLVALEDSSRNLYKSNEVFGLALKGLESESTVKRLIQDRNLWRKKHDDLADELDDKIIALEEKLKDKDASLDEASKIINDAREKHRDLEIQIEHVKNGRLQAEDQIAVLENKLRDTVTLKYHDETVATATRRISILIIERDAFQRLAGDLQTEKSCMRANLENVCKERDDLRVRIDDAKVKNLDLKIQNNYLKAAIAKTEDQIAVLEDKLKDTVTLKYHDELVNSANRRIISLREERDTFHRLVGELHIEKNRIKTDLENVCKELDVLKGEIVKHEEAYCARNALIDELFTENEELKIKIEKFKTFFTGED